MNTVVKARVRDTEDIGKEMLSILVDIVLLKKFGSYLDDDGTRVWLGDADAKSLIDARQLELSTLADSYVLSKLSTEGG